MTCAGAFAMVDTEQINKNRGLGIWLLILYVGAATMFSLTGYGNFFSPKGPTELVICPCEVGDDERCNGETCVDQ